MPETPVTTRLSRFALGLLVYSLFVILWGAYVRASFSGDGCGEHWPLCHGVVLPNDPSTKTLIELAHRVTSGLALVGAAMLPWLARRHAPPGAPVRRAASLGLLFMITEALVGAAIVVLRKVANDISVARGYWMAAHLINTFLLLAALVAAVYFAAQPSARQRDPGDPERVRWPFVVGVVLMLLTGTTGAVTALGDTLSRPRASRPRSRRSSILARIRSCACASFIRSPRCSRRASWRTWRAPVWKSAASACQLARSWRSRSCKWRSASPTCC